MATAFDTTYSISGVSTVSYAGKTKVDRLTDGTPRLRVLSGSIPADLEVEMVPMDSTTSSLFSDYLDSVAAEELYITHNGKTYTGYIQGDSIAWDYSSGLYVWRFTLICLVS